VRTVQLNALVTTQLDGSGNGTASIGPTGSGEVWPAGYVVGVHCATMTAEAIARGWAGSGQPAGFLGATTWGSTGDTNADTPQLVSGQQVTVQWIGGDSGTQAYLTVTGTRQVP
jgi:hypothetical protein